MLRRAEEIWDALPKTWVRRRDGRSWRKLGGSVGGGVGVWGERWTVAPSLVWFI
jgi:hypothetical protein